MGRAGKQTHLICASERIMKEVRSGGRVPGPELYLGDDTTSSINMGMLENRCDAQDSSL